MSLSTEQVQTIKKILREILSRTSPEELMLVDDSITREGGDDKTDGMLGFGLGPEYQLLLPVILDALRQMASSTAAELIAAWGIDLVRIFAQGRRDSIDPEAVQKLRRVFLTRLQRQGFDDEQATRAADSVVAAMISRWDLVVKLRAD
jgi:hypothetical protein